MSSLVCLSSLSTLAAATYIFVSHQKSLSVHCKICDVNPPMLTARRDLHHKYVLATGLFVKSITSNIMTGISGN